MDAILAKCGLFDLRYITAPTVLSAGEGSTIENTQRPVCCLSDNRSEDTKIQEDCLDSIRYSRTLPANANCGRLTITVIRNQELAFS
ncbi:hypothetical protein LSH36_598g01016 [Paralvinella palmiformis]|uniref:Uncharacterized protein n=1 Tax=Paralvinella palmiformis TaxID=53620 RepID=A0AAD9J4N3_9ANNE|nr:hypothetical protein LSH36_598g01016 [Paralvinella palmiformis]